MHVSILPPTHDSPLLISGDVEIHPGATMAPGVLLQAEPGARIVIENGACIGMGSILHASGGTLRLAEGVILGSGVLLIGQVMVAAHACIGSASTIMDSAIAPNAIIPPGSLIGVQEAAASFGVASLQVETSTHIFAATVTSQSLHPLCDPPSPPATAPAVPSSRPTSDDPWSDGAEPSPQHNSAPPNSISSTPAPTSPVPTEVTVDSESPSIAEDPGTSSSESVATQVSPSPPSSQDAEDLSHTRLGATAIYGKAKLNKLLVTLLPHRQLNNSNVAPPPDED